MSRTPKSDNTLRWTANPSLRLVLFSNRDSEIERWVQEAGHHCQRFTDNKKMQNWCINMVHDIVLMDVTESNYEQCNIALKAMQASDNFDSPVLVLAACKSELSIVNALEAGATDFLAKPVNRLELMARLRSLMHKNSHNVTIQDFSPYVFDIGSRQLYINGKLVELTTREFSLTLYLFHNVGKIVLRKKILADIWGISNEIDTRRVDTYISRIRTKLGLNGEVSDWRINSIYQKGYILEYKACNTSEKDSQTRRLTAS